MTTLITLNEEMLGIIKLVKILEECGSTIKSISEIIQNAAKEQKGAFLSLLLDTLGANILGRIMTGK